MILFQCTIFSVLNNKIHKSFEKESFPTAETFTRKTNDKENIFHHIGIYSYEIETLKKFVSLKQSHNEIKNKLEQLRALDNDIKINVALATSHGYLHHGEEIDLNPKL